MKVNDPLIVAVDSTVKLAKDELNIIRAFDDALGKVLKRSVQWTLNMAVAAPKGRRSR